MPKTITLIDTARLSIPTPLDEDGRCFRVSADMEYAHSDNPAGDEIIAIVVGNKYFNKIWDSFFVRGQAGDVVSLAPFDS